MPKLKPIELHFSEFNTLQALSMSGINPEVVGNHFSTMVHVYSEFIRAVAKRLQ